MGDVLGVLPPLLQQYVAKAIMTGQTPDAAPKSDRQPAAGATFADRFAAADAPPAAPPAPTPGFGFLNGNPFPYGAPSTSTMHFPDVLPPNATPTAGPPLDITPPTPGPAKAADIPDTSLLGRLGNAFSRIGDAINAHPQTLMALGAGLAGAPSLGIGISRGLAGAGPASQIDLKQTQQNATISAMMKRGIPPDVAIAAASNPAIMAQLLPQIFGPKQLQFTQIGEDMLGNKRFGFVDPVGGKVYDTSGKPIDASAVGAGMVPKSPTTGEPMQGRELLTHLEKTDPVTAAGVKSIIAGNENAAGRNLQKLLPLAALIEPGFTQQTYQTRLALAKSYTSGKQFNEIQAINTVSGHLADLANAADKLNNFESLGPLNKPLNMLTGAYRDMAQDSRVSDFNTVKQAVSNELSKAYRGGHVTEGDVREWQSNINSIQTPEQLRTVIGRLNELLASKRQALEDGWKQGMGANPLPNEFRAESERARERFNAVAGWSVGGAAPPSPGLGMRAGASPQTPLPASGKVPVRTATNPQTGERVADYGDGKWVPVR